MNLRTPINLLTHSPPCIGGLLRRRDLTLVKGRVQLLLKGKFDPFFTKEDYDWKIPQLYCYWDFAWEAIVFRGGWMDRMPEKPVLLDIGANYGIFGWLCRKRWPKATIIGFEPIPELASYCEGLKCYDRVFPLALSENNGTATLFLDYSLGLTASLGGNELLNYTSAQIQVETKKLDELDLRPDFMKVDVDGSELKTIKGGVKTFGRCSFSVIECTGKDRPKAVQDLLQKKCKKLYVLGLDYLFYDYQREFVCLPEQIVHVWRVGEVVGQVRWKLIELGVRIAEQHYIGTLAGLIIPDAVFFIHVAVGVPGPVALNDLGGRALGDLPRLYRSVGGIYNLPPAGNCV